MNEFPVPTDLSDIPETCPDCGEPTPKDFQEGDTCSICGYTDVTQL